MKRAALFDENIKEFEPTFEIKDRWSGSFVLNGWRCRARIEEGGWLVLTVALAGDDEEMFIRQREIHGPAKVISGPALTVDVPIEKDFYTSFALARRSIKRGLDGTLGKEIVARKYADPEMVIALLEERFVAARVEPTRNDEGFLLRSNTGKLSQRIEVKLDGEYVRWSGDLVRLRDVGNASRRALAHFLLALNQRLKFARALIGDDRAALEVMVPAARLTAALIDHAMRAIIAGAAASRRECAALTDQKAAETYCRFHEVEFFSTGQERTETVLTTDN